MIDDRVDLSSLDPTRDPGTVDRAMASVLARASAVERGRRQRRQSVADIMAYTAALFRPVAAATLTVAAIAALVLAFIRPPGAQLPRVWTSADALGIPEQIVEWSTTTTSPPPLALVSAVVHAGGGRGTPSR